MKKILVLCFGDIKSDARVTRQLKFLTREYLVTIACFDAYPNSGYEIFKLEKTKLTFTRKLFTSLFLITGLFEIAYKILYSYFRYVPDLKKPQFDLIVANDIETLPLAFRIAEGKSKIFFDAHEYAPKQFEDRLYWKIFFKRFNNYLCQRYLPEIKGMSTINKGIANQFSIDFGMESVIINNAAPYHEFEVIERKVYPIKLVHHGIFNKSRQPELMLDLMDLLNEKFTLDLYYLMPESSSNDSKAYFEFFKKRANKNSRIKIHPPLKPNEIVPTLNNNYDLGVILVPPVNFNYENGLPNKLFDCIQARMAMAIGPLKEIAHVVNSYQIGIVSEEFTPQSLAKKLRLLTPERVNEFKRNSEKAAKEMNAEVNQKVFLEAIGKL